MASQEHYSLRWNDHQNQILLAFDALLQTKSLVDVTLVCADTSIRAHKVVLSACSPFFQRVFAENPCKHPVIVLKDFNGWVVQAIVDFMYRGEISVPQERLQTLIQAGESLQVRGLIDHPVTGNTPTPAASPDDFNGLISNRGETTFLNHKLMFTPQIFMDGSYNNRDKSSIIDSLCTSPMPRRKQARPRRRSGDFTPQELNNGEHHPNEDDYDTENNKNFKNIDADRRDDKESLSKASSVLSLDTAIDEPEDLCTKPVDMNDDDVVCAGGDELSVSAKQQQKFSGPVQNDEDASSDRAKRNSNSGSAVVSGSSSGGNHSAKRHSGNSKGEKGDNRIVLSLKDIRHFNNAASDSQRAHHLMTSRFLSQSPSSLLKSMSSHLGFNASGGGGGVDHLSPKSLADAKFNAMQFRGPAMDLTGVGGGRHGKYFGSHHHHPHHQNDDEGADEQGHDDDEEDEDEPRDHMDTESCDDNKNARDEEGQEGRKSNSKEGKAERRDRHMQMANHHQHSEMEDNNNNSRLDMLMSMNGQNALLMEHMEFKHRQQQLFQQHNGLDSLKAGHHLSQQHRTASGPGDLMAEARKNHNESSPVGNPHHRAKDFSGSSPMNLPPPFNMAQPGDAHPSFPSMPSVSALALTPPHMFGIDTPLGLFPPPGMDPSKLYSPLMEMSDPRGMHPEQQPYLKKKGKFLGRPKGQHSAPRGGPPRSWTNAELTEALQHVWNKKMTTSQASRIFGIPYNSLLMYVRGKYGKSLKLEQLRKDCISGPPIELLQMGVNKSGGGGGANSNNGSNNGSGNNNNNNGGGGRGDNGSHTNHGGSTKEMKEYEMMGGGGPDIHNDMLSSSNPMFNPFPANFYPDFAAGFPGLPLSMLNLLPPDGRQAASLAAAAAAAGHLPNMSMEDDEEDCKSEDRSKQSLEDDDYGSTVNSSSQPLDLNNREILQHPLTSNTH